MKQCKLCGKEVKTTELCKSCSVKKGKKEWPKPFENIKNKLCDYGCGDLAKYQFKNKKICCSKGAHHCPEVRRKNSENTKGKPSGMLGKHHSKETKEILKEKNIGKVCWNKGLTKETDERVKRISEFHTEKQISQETRDKISIGLKSSKKFKEAHTSKEYRSNLSKALIGREFSEEHKKNISNSLKKSNLRKQMFESDEYRSNMSKSTSGSKNGNYKGLDGIWSSYDTCKPHLTPIEEIKRDPKNKNILNVRCSYCNKWYRPTSTSVMNRSIGINNGTCKFYCSEECKELCSDYGQMIYPKGFKKANTYEVDPNLRKLVFERDKWKCQKCYSETSLECHHIDPVALEPLFSNDIDSCITLCKECHKFIHMNLEGCGYKEISKEKQKRNSNC